jgi:putative cell wall-binding protein
VTAAPGGLTAQVAGTATTATVTGLTNGTAYTFTVTATTAVGTGPASAASAPVTPTAPAAPSTVTRWAGSDRYASSADFSSKSFEPGVDVAYIATGENFPDALSAAPIAGITKSPVLLTRGAFLPAAISAELGRLKPRKIVVLGSDGVVSERVRESLKALTSGSVERWYGPDRYASSADFSRRSFTTGVDVAYVATGDDFPDALSAAPAAGVTGGPILLTRSDRVPAPIATELGRLKPKRIVVLGSAGVVTAEVQSRLEAFTTGSVDRWSGSDRFASAGDFSSNTFAPGVDVAYIATGYDFPDALSAAPIAGMTRGPVLLARPSSLPPATSAELTRLRPRKIVVLGSDGVVSTGVETQLQTYLR